MDNFPCGEIKHSVLCVLTTYIAYLETMYETLQHNLTEVSFSRERPSVVTSKTLQYSQTDFAHIFQRWTLENYWLGRTVLVN